MRRIKRAVVSYLDKRLTTEHMHYKEVISIMVPSLVEQAFVVLFGILNTSMISSSGMQAVSAVGMVNTVNIFLQQVFLSLSSGGSVVVAQYSGAKNQDMVSRASSQFITMVTLVGAALGGMIIVLRGPLLGFLFGSAEPKVMELAMLYMMGSCIRYPLVGTINATCSALRGIGKTRVSLALSMISNGLMLLLNVLFITVLGLGVQGLVYSHVISGIIAAAVCVVYLVLLDKSMGFSFKKAFRFEGKVLKKLFHIGIPFAVEKLFFNGGKLLTQTFIVGMGTAATAINSICNSLMSFVQLPGNGYNLGIVTVVGKCIGRGDEEAARKYVHSMVKLTSLSSMVFAVIMVVAFPLWLEVYNVEAHMVQPFLYILLILGFGQSFIWSRGFIIPGGLRSAGDAGFTSVVAMLSMWFVRIVAGYVVGVILGWGIVGVWAAMVFEWAVRAGIFMVRFRGKKWTKYRLVD